MPCTSRARFVPEPPIYAVSRAASSADSMRRPVASSSGARLRSRPTRRWTTWRKRSRWRSTSMIHICGRFFLSGKPWDTASEYTLYPERDVFSGQQARDASRAHIRNVPLPGKTGKKEFLFLFDYGDEWHFGVKLLREIPTVRSSGALSTGGRQRGRQPRHSIPTYADDEEERSRQDRSEDARRGSLAHRTGQGHPGHAGLTAMPLAADNSLRCAEGNIGRWQRSPLTSPVG